MTSRVTCLHRPPILPSAHCAFVSGSDVSLRQNGKVENTVFHPETGHRFAIKAQQRAQLGESHRFASSLSDNVIRITCHGEPGPGRYERRRQYNLLHQSLPPARIHLGTFEGERKQNRAGYDEAGSGMQMVFSALALSLSVLGGLMIAYGLGAM